MSYEEKKTKKSTGKKRRRLIRSIMGTIEQVMLKKRRRRRRRERHFEKNKEKKKRRRRRRARHVGKKTKRTWEGHLWKSLSPSFPPNLGGKKMWARRKNFFSSFPTFLFSFPKQIVENNIFHPLYFHPKRTEPKGLFGYRLLLKTEN